MQRLPLGFFDRHSHGELMSRYTNDIDTVQMAFEMSLVQLASGTLNLVGAIVMMLLLSPILLLITLGVLGLMVFVMREIGRKSRAYFRAQQRDLGNLNGYVEETVEGLKVVKVFSHEPSAIAEFLNRNEAYRRAATYANFYAGVVMPVVGNLGNVSYAATALVGGLLSVWGRFDIGSLAAFLQYSRQLGMPVQMISNQLNMVLAALAGAERVFEVMDQAPEVDGGQVVLVGVTKQPDGSLIVNPAGSHPTHWAWQCPQPDDSVKFVELKGDLRFHGVTFGYTEGQTVLHDVSLFAKPGQKIAFVGSTGAGPPDRSRPPPRCRRRPRHAGRR
jgi:ATP-binding cassette subfamily B protein